MVDSILPGTDNLFKYLLTMGFVMLFFALIYPLQKEQALKIEELSLLMKVDKLQFDIQMLNLGVLELKENNSGELNELNKISRDLKHKHIEMGYEIRKQRELEHQIKSYWWFKVIFIGGGILCVFLGFRFWLSSTFVDESERCRQLSPSYCSSFIRIRYWLKKSIRYKGKRPDTK